MSLSDSIEKIFCGSMTTTATCGGGRLRMTSQPKTPDGGKHCPRCDRTKPSGAFYVWSGGRVSCWCKVCCRLGAGLTRQTEEYKVWLAEYEARPEIRQRRRAYQQEYGRTQKRRSQIYGWRKTPRGKLSRARTSYKQKLKTATTPERARYLQSLIDSCTMELDRIRAAS